MGVEAAPAQELSMVGGIRLEKVTANIGALVHGVDVHVVHGDEVASVLLRSLHEHGVGMTHAAHAASGHSDRVAT